MSVRKTCYTCKYYKHGGICCYGNVRGYKVCNDDMLNWELSDVYKADLIHDAETVPVVTEQAEAVHDYRKCANQCRDCNILSCDECTNFVPKRDAVHPDHYQKGGMECFDVIKAITGDKYEGFLVGNIIKYIFRYRDKNGLEDCKKAAVYLDKLIKELENEK